MALDELHRLHDWMEVRQPLVIEFGALINVQAGEDWPGFRATGHEYDMRKGSLKPRYEGVPAGRIQYTVGEGPEWSTVVELAARMTAVRSRRWDPKNQKVRPIPAAWRTLTAEAFPFLCTMEIGDGWADLMIATAGWIAEIGPPSGWRFGQIKEKYGTLRLYDGPTPELDDICVAAERLSGHICDRCGGVGRLRTVGWMATRCDDHV